MDLSFNRKSIFRKSFRRHTSSSIPPAAASLMKSLKKNQSTRRSMKMSLRRCNAEKEIINLKPGNTCRSPTLSLKIIPHNDNDDDDDEDKLLPTSPILKRRESFFKLSGTPSKWSRSTTPIKRKVFRVVSVMEKAIWDKPKKQVSKLFGRGSASLDICPSGSSMDLSGSYKVLIFE